MRIDRRTISKLERMRDYLDCIKTEYENRDWECAEDAVTESMLQIEEVIGDIKDKLN